MVSPVPLCPENDIGHSLYCKSRVHTILKRQNPENSDNYYQSKLVPKVDQYAEQPYWMKLFMGKYYRWAENKIINM